MNPALQQLKDIHLPGAVSTLPTAPGWIILYLLAIGSVTYSIYKLLQSRQRKKTIKFALGKLRKLQALESAHSNEINIAAEISTLIRRTALYYYPREKVAGLSGSEWLAFLNQSGNTTHFTEVTGQLLIDAAYRKNSTFDVTPLFGLTEAWLLAISKRNKLK